MAGNGKGCRCMSVWTLQLFELAYCSLGRRKQFFNLAFEFCLVQARSLCNTFQLVHPESRFAGRSITITIRPIKQVNIPRDSVDVEHLLPLFPGQLVAVPVITNSCIIELFGSGLCSTFIIARVHRQKNDMDAQTIIRNILQDALDVSESVATEWANGRDQIRVTLSASC